MTTTNWIEHPSLVLPAYTYVDVARYTGVPVQTVRNWFRGTTASGRIMHPVFDRNETPGLSYLQLAETVFVAAMRQRKVKLSTLRTAYAYVKDTLGVQYPFVQQRYLTNGTDLLIEAREDPTLLVSASDPGQLAWREAVENYTLQFDYVDQLALRWHPVERDFLIVVDPRISFGQPTVEGTGIPTRALADRSAAGDSIEYLTDDFGLSREQVKDALWFEKQNRPAA